MLRHGIFLSLRRWRRGMNKFRERDERAFNHKDLINPRKHRNLASHDINRIYPKYKRPIKTRAHQRTHFPW